MYLTDVTAIDRLIDYYGEYSTVEYNTHLYYLEDLREMFVVKKIQCGLDNHFVKSDGIYNKDNIIKIKVHKSDISKDDLINF